MGKKDFRVDAFIAKSAEFARPILWHIRELIHAACPDVEETIKWGFPHFMYGGILCSMAAFKQYCAFGFWHPELRAPRPGGGREEHTIGQYGRVRSLADLPTDTALTRQIKKAMKLNESGVKPSRPPMPQTAKALVVSNDLKAALEQHKGAQATFARFSYTNKKEYAQWISEAKRAETRAKRLATAIAWMAEGKTRNWKYKRK